MQHPLLIAVTGGIGSGKSVVCNVLRALGYPVYDCDSQAKALMDSSAMIKRRLVIEVCQDAIDNDGKIDRKAIAATVFSDPFKLKKLNSIVHSAVREDIRDWVKRHACGQDLNQLNQQPKRLDSEQQPHPSLLFVETAILYESGLDREVQAVWEVTAPIDLRIARVQQRSGLTPEEIRARIAAQSHSTITPHPHTRHICNDGSISLLQQIHNLLQ